MSLINIKNKKAFIFAVIALAASVILLLMPEYSESGDTESENSPEEYRKSLENQISDILEEIANVKECKVMITLKSGYEYYYASDEALNETSTGRESKREYVIIQNGSSQNAVLIEERMPTVSGVAVVAEGISPEEEYKILQVISALFNLPTSRISIQS